MLYTAREALQVAKIADVISVSLYVQSTWIERLTVQLLLLSGPCRSIGIGSLHAHVHSSTGRLHCDLHECVYHLGLYLPVLCYKKKFLVRVSP